MRSRLCRWRWVVAVLAAGATLGAPAAAAPAGTGPAGTAPDFAPVAVWEMNERRGAETMRDSGGRGIDGRIGSEIISGVRAGGETAYRFTRLTPDRPPARPQHLVRVWDHPALDPGDRDFVVTVRMRTTASFGNVIQKGQNAARGGYFKIQNPGGRIQCLFRGSRGTRSAWSPRPLDDGRWHTIRCRRSSRGVSLEVDGRRLAYADGYVGTIANEWPLSIGGKVACDQRRVTCDYFAGDIDRVRIDAG